MAQSLLNLVKKVCRDFASFPRIGKIPEGLCCLLLPVAGCVCVVIAVPSLQMLFEALTPSGLISLAAINPCLKTFFPLPFFGPGLACHLVCFTFCLEAFITG